jgi:Methyltransferase domain
MERQGIDPTRVFWSTHYVRHNQRRQEHLASLGLPLSNQTVLEVGAGIGDHTSFFLDRDCDVIVTEAQDQNLTILRRRYPDLDVRQVDLNHPPPDAIEVDIVYCYGTLYHLSRPAQAITWMARCALRMLLIETCVGPGRRAEVTPFYERAGDPENAATGQGCRPTRSWVRRELAAHFPYVYLPLTQPFHEEFPLDWTRPDLATRSLTRAVFVASRRPIANPVLTNVLPLQQVHDGPSAQTEVIGRSANQTL